MRDYRMDGLSILLLTGLVERDGGLFVFIMEWLIQYSLSENIRGLRQRRLDGIGFAIFGEISAGPTRLRFGLRRGRPDPRNDSISRRRRRHDP